MVLRPGVDCDDWWTRYETLNCRRVNSLLSAYLDSELTGAEMLAIREHLHCCASCYEEHEALSQTKRLVSSLALKAPRAELEALLLREATIAQQPWSNQLHWLPMWISDRIEGLWSGDSSSLALTRGGVLRVKPLAATAVLSIAGFCLASAAVDGPSDLAAPSAEVADVLSAAPTVSSELREIRSPAREMMRSAAILPVSYAASGLAPIPVSMTSGSIATAVSPAGAYTPAPRLTSSPASLSVTEGASPTIWQAGSHSPSILLSVQRAFFPR
jgi:anti-sigma factor RsiW